MQQLTKRAMGTSHAGQDEDIMSNGKLPSGCKHTSQEAKFGHSQTSLNPEHSNKQRQRLSLTQVSLKHLCQEMKIGPSSNQFRTTPTPHPTLPLPLKIKLKCISLKFNFEMGKPDFFLEYSLSKQLLASS